MHNVIINVVKIIKLFRAYIIVLHLLFDSVVRPGLEHIRIIRDGTPNQYMVLLKFRDEVLCLYTYFFTSVIFSSAVLEGVVIVRYRSSKSGEIKFPMQETTSFKE